MYTKDNHATAGAHAHAPPGTLIAGRYEVVKQAGTGNFARVFECIDRRTGDLVAVKLLKRGYERDADFECDILKAINKHDLANKQNVVKLLERTTWNGLAMIVFNLKGAPLRNSTMPFSGRDVAVVARDVGEALSFLHFTVRAVHTDLKPENILAEIRPPTGAPQWSICDLGSASFYTSRLDTDLITTRPYRAPEVVLNKGWSYAADTWSLGCILYELRTGRKLFDCHTDAEHLSAMEQRLGPIPNSNRRPSVVGRRLPLLVEEMRNEDPDFVDLLCKLLHYDPARRIRCSDIATHPFVTKHKMPSRSASSSSVSSVASTNSNSDVASLTKNMGEMKVKPTAAAPAPVAAPRGSSGTTVAAVGTRALGEISRAAMNSRSTSSASKPLISPAVPQPSAKPRNVYAF